MSEKPVSLVELSLLVAAYGSACARTARAPRLSPAQQASINAETAAHAALMKAIGVLVKGKESADSLLAEAYVALDVGQSVETE